MYSKSISIKTEKIEKKFGKTLLFKNINLNIERGDTFYITGPNGSGKSTLLQILAGIQKPSSGNVIYSSDGSILDCDNYKNYFGFSGPQVNPYDMLTAIENLTLASNAYADEKLMKSYLETFDLYRHRDKYIKNYSSGMKQRLRLIHALINDPEILMLDEPCTNLDTKGRDILYKTLNEIKKDKIVIIATNETEDIYLCSRGINLEQ